jgi:hypothetical protein
MVNPTFDNVYVQLRQRGSATVVSSQETVYVVTAEQEPDGRPVIIARPPTGEVRIHEDCWGEFLTCERTSAGGVYDGAASIYDWSRKN